MQKGKLVFFKKCGIFPVNPFSWDPFKRKNGFSFSPKQKEVIL